MNFGNCSLLLVDDDPVFAAILSRALSARGFVPRVAADIAEAIDAALWEPIDYAVLDLKLGDESGLDLITRLLEILPHLRILLLTGYPSIATAVEAIKRGAYGYLAKPADVAAIARLLLDDPDDASACSHAPASPPLRRLEWEHIQRVLTDCSGNISEAARRLGLHRRTLQRKLTKRPVSEQRYG